MTAFDTWCKENELVIAPDGDKPVFAWIDLETTGLEYDDVILEMGILLTNEWGEVINSGLFHTLVYENSRHYHERIASMPVVVAEMHNKSGLMEELRSTPGIPSIHTACHAACNFLDIYCEPKTVYLAGSSVNFDERMLIHYMPEVLEKLHYRQNNVSTLKILAQKLNPRLVDPDKFSWKKRELHRPIPDLVDSVHEYIHYVDNFLWVDGDNEQDIEEIDDHSEVEREETKPDARRGLAFNP